MARTALFQALKKAHPDLSDAEVHEELDRAVSQERDLVRKGLAPDRAKEIARAELFEGLTGWEGDEEYGPLP